MVMRDESNSFGRLVDPVIDDIAREMTGARPADDAEGFVRRVSARIQNENAARTEPMWRRTWLLAPVAAIVLVLAALVVRETNVRLKPDATTETASGLRAQGSGLAEVQPSVLSAQPSALGPEPSTGRARPRLVRAAATAPGLSGDADFQPATTAPIEMASLDVSPLVVAMPIEIPAIAIDRIEIAAMP